MIDLSGRAFGIGALDMVSTRRVRRGLFDSANRDHVLLATKNRVTIFIKSCNNERRLLHAAALQHLSNSLFLTVANNMLSYGSVVARCAPPPTRKCLCLRGVVEKRGEGCGVRFFKIVEIAMREVVCGARTTTAQKRMCG